MLFRSEQFVAAFAAEQGKRMTPQIWPLSRANGPARGTFVFVNPKARNPTLPQGYAGVIAAASKAGDETASASGIIEVTSTVRGLLLLDGRDVGYIAPGYNRTFSEQLIGRHQVRLTRGLMGPDIEAREVATEEGKISRVAFGVKSPIRKDGSAAPIGRLVIASHDGLDGEVYVDDYKVGHLDKSGTLTVQNLIAGSHFMLIDGAGQSMSGLVDIRPNDTTYTEARPEVPTNLSVIAQ